MNYTRLAQEMRENMIQQGLNPEIVKSYLKQTFELQTRKFNNVSRNLSEEERTKAELTLLQGELLLAVIDRCCEVNG